MDPRPCTMIFILFIAPLLLGSGLIGLSFHVRSGYLSYFATVLNNEDWNHAMNTTLIFIVVGALVILFTSLPLFGLVMRNFQVWILSTITMGTVLLVVEVIAAIILYTKEYNNMKVDIRKAMNTSMEIYYNKSLPTRNYSVEFWDNLQTEMNCCGVDSYAEWANSSDSPILGFIPNSCCIKGTQAIGGSCTKLITRNFTHNLNFASMFIHTEGCYHRLDNYYPVNVLGILTIILGGFQAMGLVILVIFIIRICTRYEGFYDDDDGDYDVEGSAISDESASCEPSIAD